MRPATLLAGLVIALVPALAHAVPPAAPAASAPSASKAPPAPPPPPAPTGEVRVPADQGLITPLPDGVQVVFEAGTTGRWGGPGKLASETAKWTRGFHLELTDGEIDVTLPAGPKGEHAFLVSTKAGTLTAWRGGMHVTARGDVTSVVLYDGAVAVGSNKQSFSIVDSGAVVLHKGGEADKARAVPAVPSWDGGSGAPSFAVVPEGVGATLGLAWASAANAASYRVQIATDAAMTQIAHRAAVGEPRFSIPAPSAGIHYFAQVRSVGSDGVVGAWSSPRPLRVVHFRLPPGAFVARDGVVVMPDGATLPLSDADGFEVSYENVRPGPAPATPASLYWSALTGPLRMADDAPLRIVHLRDAGQGGEARVALARRQLRADVALQPKEPRAVDPIDVRAVVWDPSGRVDLASESVTLTAMVDLDPVAVAWQHASESGRTVWTGRIGARTVRGPSVVRVVAKDSLGQEIGRGFVELGSASR